MWFNYLSLGSVGEASRCCVELFCFFMSDETIRHSSQCLASTGYKGRGVGAFFRAVCFHACLRYIDARHMHMIRPRSREKCKRWLGCGTSILQLSLLVFSLFLALQGVPRLNTVFLTGYLGQDPKPKYFDSGKVVLNLSLAVKREYHPIEVQHRHSTQQRSNLAVKRKP